MSICVKIE